MPFVQQRQLQRVVWWQLLLELVCLREAGALVGQGHHSLLGVVFQHPGGEARCGDSGVHAALRLFGLQGGVGR
eukprot:7997426-Lingulodinium_polyedra.AAC.1